MLTINVPECELFDERTSTFVTVKPQALNLEHSLISLAKWEAEWEKPFLSSKEKTAIEVDSYIRSMTLTKNVDPNVYARLTKEDYSRIDAYIDAPMTATWFSDSSKGRPSREQVTAELIYYWMISLNIPFECQKWHLNRLLALIKVCSIKNGKPRKMSNREILNQNAALNKARQKRFKTKG